MATSEKDRDSSRTVARTTYGGRPRMPLEDRAKIFSPFDPLQGFREALLAKEQEVEEATLEEWERSPGK